MTIKNILFDLDGVLFDGCELHASLFLESLSKFRPDLNITREYHDKYLNALSTRKKLDYLQISKNEAESIYLYKQELTKSRLNNFVKTDQKVINICNTLILNYRIFCVSNSIRLTIETCLTKMGVIDFFSGIISNEDTIEPKPSPEPYLTLYRKYNLNPIECLIIEDSPYGIESAIKSGGHVMQVRDCNDVTIDNIVNFIKSVQKELLDVK